MANGSHFEAKEPVMEITTVETDAQKTTRYIEDVSKSSDDDRADFDALTRVYGKRAERALSMQHPFFDTDESDAPSMSVALW